MSARASPTRSKERGAQSPGLTERDPRGLRSITPRQEKRLSTGAYTHAARSQAGKGGWGRKLKGKPVETVVYLS
jgi:hypothetical protein